MVDENKRLKKRVERLAAQQRRAWSLEKAVGADIPRQSFREWCKSLAAAPRHLEHVFKHGRIEGFTYLATELIGEHREELPLRAFKERKDAVYAYGEEGKWSRLENSDWELFLNILDKLLRIQFNGWQDAHALQITNPAFQELYITNMCKLNGKGERRGK